MAVTLTRALAWAAATDEANRHMRRNGRSAWNEDDYNVACEAFYRLWPDSVKLAPFTGGADHE